MIPFDYVRPSSLPQAVEAASEDGALVVAGGTNVVDLMRAGVLAPAKLVDVSGLAELRRLSMEGPALRFGALVTMAEAAASLELRSGYPALVEGLAQAASQQLRNRATVAGAILQRTRCPYYRDGFSPCNKRQPGLGCAALDGHDRDAAVLGGSNQCVAVYPGDWGTALAAFDADVELVSAHGRRTLPFSELHREPGARPDIETRLRPGEIMVAVTVKATPAGRRSAYVKIRDRRSYAFAVASAAVALELRGEVVVDARVALGGVATRPWRSPEAEDGLIGARLTPESALKAGEAAFAQARVLKENGVKLRLGPRAVAEAVRIAAGRGDLT